MTNKIKNKYSLIFKDHDRFYQKIFLYIVLFLNIIFCISQGYSSLIWQETDRNEIYDLVGKLTDNLGQKVTDTLGNESKPNIAVINLEIFYKNSTTPTICSNP